MKVTVCAVAKNEDKYINDFCRYYLSLGFDEIHLYDNNESGNLADKCPKDSRIKVHPLHDRKVCAQQYAYNTYLADGKFDWCAFIDIDEFITLNGFTDIHDFIASFDSKVNCIRLFEKVYGDDGLFEPVDASVPVYERIKTVSEKYKWSMCKNIVKKTTGLKIVHPHLVRGDKLNLADADHTVPSNPIIYRIEKYGMKEGGAYIRHFKTKTLAEFCEQKLNTGRVFCPDEKRTSDYYFEVNEETPEKLAYIKKHVK